MATTNSSSDESPIEKPVRINPPGSRVDDAEQIRQEFVKASRRIPLPEEIEKPSAKGLEDDEC
jgi:hypothetical protein